MIGGMNRYIDIQNPTRTSDNTGGQTTSYASVKKLFAQIKPATGRRLLEFGQTANMKLYEIGIPFYLEVTVDEESLIVYDGRTLQVHSVIDEDEGRTKRTIIAFEKK